MFHSARVRLTAWYLLIIMVVSLLFSGIIYNGINQELSRFEDFQSARQERIQVVFGDRVPPEVVSQFASAQKEIQDARGRLIAMLTIINVGILVISGVAGYFLAGRTLLPIKKMLDDQKQFISDASHELRTPLTALRSEIEVELRNSSLTLSEAKKLLQSNLEEVINLQLLADNLLQLTQPKVQKGVGVFENVHIQDVIAQALKKVSPLAKKKKISIAVSKGDGIVKGDVISLTQLFVIVLDNAIKYSPSQTAIAVSVAKQEGMYVMRVKDQGVGIAKKDLPHIFDRFYRADKARTKGGYGLGLSIAKKIVDDHSGDISIESTLKKGTTISIRLPASKRGR